MRACINDEVITKPAARWRQTESVDALRPLTDEALARVIKRLRNPKPGGKVEAAREFGVDVTLLIEQIKLSPADRADRMHSLAVTAESVFLSDILKRFAPMPLSPGDKLGPYQILSLLGRGGMGEVFRAHDPRLRRDVAIKISSERFNERFEREARAVAALNHPNICQIYDISPDYLVMEYVEGTPITPVDTTRKLLDIAVQICDGLAAAHAARIVHRDLKPDNILITREGRVKILDFGLAKSAHTEIASEDATLTLVANATDPGTTVGTIAYMSPEQARGLTNLTVQSDQFSFGLVLYELATGKRAFQGGSAAEVMTAIIRADAEPLPASVPAPFRWIVERLLSKEPAERYDSTRDLFRELRQVRDRLSESVSAAVITASETRSAPFKKRIGAVAMGMALALGGGATALLVDPARADLSAYRFTPITREARWNTSPEWSPDGKSLVYTAQVHGIFQVFSKAVGATDTAQLTHAAVGCYSPFWSPDGASIYYESEGQLWAVGTSGGAPESVMKKVSGVALHPDGNTLIFRRDGRFWAGALRGGTPRELGQVPHGRVTAARFSPDGSKLAVVASGELWILPWPLGKPRNFGAVGFTANWLPDSRHVVTSGGAGDSVNFTLSLLDTSDGSRRVIYRGTYSISDASVSKDGKRLAYAGGAISWHILEISLSEGRVRTLDGGGRVSWLPDWAPSGTHYLFSAGGVGTTRAIEDRSVAEGFSRRVAEAPQSGGDVSVYAPRWAPDGSRFLFIQFSFMRRQLMIANASGGQWTPLADANFETSHTWSADGQWIAFLRVDGGKQQLLKMRPSAGAVPVVLANAAPVSGGYQPIEWSSTGDWIAYASAEGISMISPDGKVVRKLTDRRLGTFAFSKDGTQVYGMIRNTTGVGAQWQLYSIDVKTGSDRMLAPVDLPLTADLVAGFSLHPDGRRFLTSVGELPFDIWMLEGWDQTQQKTWLDRLLRR